MRCCIVLGILALLVSYAEGAQKLLVASYLHNDVLAYDAQTGTSLGVFVPTGLGGLNQPSDLAFGTSNDLFVGSNSPNQILRFHGQTGALVQKYVMPNGDNARGFAFGADGNLYVADTTAKAIQRFDPISGSYLGVFAHAGGAPIGISFGPDGNLYAAIASPQTAFTGRVERFNPTSGQSLGVFGPKNFNNPQSLTFGPDHNLYVHIQDDHNIVRLNGLTGQLMGTFVDEEYPFNPSSGIVFGPDGNLYTGNLTAGARNDGVRRYNGTTGAFINNFVPGDGNFWSTGLAFTPVPEPSTISLLIIVAAPVLLHPRRRRAHCMVAP